MKECITHGMPCLYYRRSSESAMCEQCKKEAEKKSTQHMDDNTQSFVRKQTQYGNNSQNNGTLEKDTILPVEYYAKTFFETVKQKYVDMIDQYN